MAAKSPVVLILGAGPNIGQALVRTFASKGYKVALAARSLKEADSTDNQLNISSDFSKTDDVVNAFTKVKNVRVGTHGRLWYDHSELTGRAYGP
jgi:NAD(P)-dependent dehydrogenase (short-subunit alcohol dehydrogenase family)